MYQTLVEKNKIIRKILKEQFPDIKFKVRKQSHCSIGISYKDGVPQKEVEKFVKEFESIDRCEMTGEILSGGNDFVFVNREVSEENKEKVMELLYRDHKGVMEATHLSPFDRDRIVWQVLSSMDFRKPIEIVLGWGSLSGNMGERD